MKVGTKSVLFGAHAFWLHPWFVALAWARLYGFPWDPRLWVAFFVHDLGYWGKAEMDDKDGETHPVWGARVMNIFDLGGSHWRDLALYHSRFYAKQHGREPSRLCVADKFSICLTPFWLYYPMARLSGELREYMARSRADGKYATMHLDTEDARVWYRQVQEYFREWIAEHRDGGPDTMTPPNEVDFLCMKCGKRGALPPDPPPSHYQPCLADCGGQMIPVITIRDVRPAEESCG